MVTYPRPALHNQVKPVGFAFFWLIGSIKFILILYFLYRINSTTPHEPSLRTRQSVSLHLSEYRTFWLIIA